MITGGIRLGCRQARQDANGDDAEEHRPLYRRLSALEVVDSKTLRARTETVPATACFRQAHVKLRWVPPPPASIGMPVEVVDDHRHERRRLLQLHIEKHPEDAPRVRRMLREDHQHHYYNNSNNQHSKRQLLTPRRRRLWWNPFKAAAKAVGKAAEFVGKTVVNVASAGVTMARKGVKVVAKVVNTVVQAVSPFPMEFDKQKTWDVFNFNYNKAADSAEEAEKVRLQMRCSKYTTYDKMID